ncbi:hypothetical protein B0H16DRAFT_1897468 [Mycena metata]|uniref:Uncharacterized protein n=1 Tax=Mycena metata TaxID=1033252 RepID=A0AAD7MIX9_9AGAR|nr:hypothetical protein B0H16DRAFT_1897468 [Mycena metata]
MRTRRRLRGCRRAHIRASSPSPLPLPSTPSPRTGQSMACFLQAALSAANIIFAVTSIYVPPPSPLPPHFPAYHPLTPTLVHRIGAPSTPKFRVRRNDCVPSSIAAKRHLGVGLGSR